MPPTRTLSAERDAEVMIGSDPRSGNRPSARMPSALIATGEASLRPEAPSLAETIAPLVSEGVMTAVTTASLSPDRVSSVRENSRLRAT
jgi:hypothetical protein